MYRRSFKHVTLGAAALAVAAFPGIVNADPICGPGPHWIDTCAEGDDFITGTVGVHIIELFKLPAGVTNPITATLSQQGDFIVRRSDPVGHVIETEIVELTLSGGGITMTVGSPFNPLLTPTLGAIAEDPGDPLLGESFFDVFFELDLGGGILVYNHDPVKMESTFPFVPPDLGLYPYEFWGTIALFDDPAAGNHVGNLLHATHIPAPGAALLALLGLPMVGWVKKRFA